jgi:hypothetical protein
MDLLDSFLEICERFCGLTDRVGGERDSRRWRPGIAAVIGFGSLVSGFGLGSWFFEF